MKKTRSKKSRDTIPLSLITTFESFKLLCPTYLHNYLALKRMIAMGEKYPLALFSILVF
jgi:hypothetical protein